MSKVLKRILKILLIAVLAVVVLAGGFLGYLTITEFDSEPVEDAEILGTNPGKQVPMGREITIISWNIGYGALGKDSDFAMDGGGKAPVADEAKVREYLSGIEQTLAAQADAEIYMLQEIDSDSSRSYGIDQRTFFSKSVNAYAMNYSCPFVPYPWPPLGKVNSGLYTASDFDIDASQRISLPCPFSWPLRIANLKRCLLVSRLPIADDDAQLVIVNQHLEAYTDPEGRQGQMDQLMEFISSEYKKGNYVIAGGDFNQTFPGTLELYPNTHPENWEPGILEEDTIPEGFSYAFDATVPTCRLLNQPYDPSDTEGTQYYVIDGFILSPNVRLRSVETLDMDFADSDHNPVKLVVDLPVKY